MLGNTNKRDREILEISRLAIWQRVFTARLLAMSRDIFGKQFGSRWGVITDMGFPGGSDSKESTCNADTKIKMACSQLAINHRNWSNESRGNWNSQTIPKLFFSK